MLKFIDMKKISRHASRRKSLFTPVLAVLFTASWSIGAPSLENSPTRLSSNENAFGYTPNAKEAMIKYIDSGSYYNRNNVMDLVEACAKKEGVPDNYIVTTAGSGPLLMMTALAYAEPGKNVVTSEMGYTQLVRKFEARGGDVKYAALGSDMGYDFDALAAAIDENTVIVYICNPNNPTGVLCDPNDLKQFVMTVSEDILVFVDEAYLELADSNFAINTCSPLVKLRKNVIVTRTFSKGYGMAGLRIGYGVADPSILEKINMFNMGPPSYLAAIAALEGIKDTAFFEKNVSLYQANRKYVTEAFDRMGIEYAEPQGAFVYYKSGIDQQMLRDKMEKFGVLVSGSRESGVEEGKYSMWSRVSVGTKPELDEFLTALSAILAES